MPMSGMRGCCAPPVVLATSKLLRAVLEQRLDQVERDARHGEAAERDHAAVPNVLHCVAEAGDLLGFLRHLLLLFVVVR